MERPKLKIKKNKKERKLTSKVSTADSHGTIAKCHRGHSRRLPQGTRTKARLLEKSTLGAHGERQWKALAAGHQSQPLAPGV